MSDLSTVEQARDYNRPFYAVHIQGFPYVWFTVVPDNWTAPSGWTYKSGLAMVQSDSGGGSTVIEQELDPLGGVADINSTNIVLVDDEDETLCGLLWSTQRLTQTNHANLVDEFYYAGADPQVMEVSRAISDAPSTNGTLYLGNQTLTYSSKSGTSFYGVDRGRYAILDQDWTEVKKKPEVKWYTHLNLPPKVTLYPTQVRGRVVTLYRNYFDVNEPDSNTALVKSQSQIRFRGTIANVKQAENFLGFIIEATDIISLLDQSVYSSGVGEAPLMGYSVPTPVQSPNDSTWYDLNPNQTYFQINERFFDITRNGTAGAPVDYAKDSKAVIIGGHYDTPEELIYAINYELTLQWLDTISKAGQFKKPEGTRSRWHLSIGLNNKVKVEYDTVGYWQAAGVGPYGTVDLVLPKGQTGNWLDDDVVFGVEGSIVATPLASALGFGEPTMSQINIEKQDKEVYLNNFKRWTNNDSWLDIISTVGKIGESYESVSMLADDEVAQAWLHVRDSNALPCDIGDSPDHNEFVEVLPDQSHFYIAVPGKAIWRASHLEYTNKEIVFNDAGYDWAHPICTVGSEDPIISVPVSLPESEVPKAVQAFIPTGRNVLASFTDGSAVVNHGIQYTILQFLTSTGTTNYNGSYDIFPGGWGLGIPKEYIDVNSFLQLSDLLGDQVMQRKYVFMGPTSMREILESEARTLGFNVVTHNGLITCVPERQATGGSVVGTIDASARVIGSTTSIQTTPEGVTNELVLELDYDCLTEEFRRTEKFVDVASVNANSAVSSATVSNKGLRSSVVNLSGGFLLHAMTDETVDEIRQLMYDRLASLCTESYLYQCTVNRSCDGIGIGQTVYVTDSRVPNPITGTRGIENHLGTVEKLSYDEVAGTGEMAIRMVYAHHENIAALATIPAWNTGNLGGALRMDNIEGNVLTYSPIYQQNKVEYWSGSLPSSSPAHATTFLAGDLIDIRNAQTGALIAQTSVSSVDATNKQLTVADTIVPPGNTVEYAISFADLDTVIDESTTEREQKVARIANANETFTIGSLMKTGFRLL